jgi:serine phosphatase RsbU (regulator of sigma subunit)
MQAYWKDLNQIAEDVQSYVDDRTLSDWTDLIENKDTPAGIKAACPPGVAVKILFSSKDLLPGGIHENGYRSMITNGKITSRVTGTLNAESDEMYRHLFDSFGWRTVVYALLDVKHALIVKTPQEDPSFVADNPVVLFSKDANALDSNQFRQLFITIKSLTVAKLLRLGLTMSATASERLKSAVPGALLGISDRFIYEINDDSREWFEIDKTKVPGLPLEDVLPGTLLKWVTDTIENRLVHEKDYVSRIMWITKANGEHIRAEAVLRRQRILQHIVPHQTMRMATEDLSIMEADEVLHYLILRDVTTQWEAEKLQQEMELARRMQINLQPIKLPDAQWFDVAAECRPANDVGGDVYDLILLPDGRLALFLGDAAGHGIDSALVAALVTGAYRSIVAQNPDPKQVLSAIDRALRTLNYSGFVTAICLLLDPSTRLLRYGLAGHPAPIICRQGHFLNADEVPSSLPLGVKLPANYQIREMGMEPGDVLSLVSDGLLETRNSTGIPFESSLKNILLNHRFRPVEDIVKRVMIGAMEYRNRFTQEDDLTAVMLRVKELPSIR